MSKLREAAKQAIDVLERAGEDLRWQSIGQAMHDLRAALAEPDADERDLYDLLVVRHLSPRKPGESLRSCVYRIIDWDVAVALDPAVSLEAQALVEQGKRNDAPAIDPVAMKYEMRTGKCYHCGKPLHPNFPCSEIAALSMDRKSMENEFDPTEQSAGLPQTEIKPVAFREAADEIERLRAELHSVKDAALDRETRAQKEIERLLKIAAASGRIPRPDAFV